MSLVLDFDFQDDADIEQARKTHLSPLLKKNDFAGAIEFVKKILHAQPARLPERIELANFYSKLGYHEKAQDSIMTALENDSDYADVAASAVQIFITAGAVEDAAEIASEFLPDLQFDPKLAHLAATALYRAKKPEQAAAAALVSCELNIGDLDRTTRAAGFLTAAGFATQAVYYLEQAGVLSTQVPAAHFEYGRAKFRLDKTDPTVAKHLEMVVKAEPSHIRAIDLLSRALLAQGRADDAADVYDRAADKINNSNSMRLHYARALRGAKRYAEAAEITLNVARDNPHNSIIQRQAASALTLAGDLKTAQDIFDTDIANRKTSLPATLAEGLAAISGRLEDCKVPPERFDWAHQRLVELGSAPKDRAAWEARVKWINLADYLILDWMECRAEDGQQISDLIDGIESSHDIIQNNLIAGKGAFLVTAHVGALFAGPAALLASGLDPVWVASTPVITKGPGTGRILSTSSNDALSISRAIMGSINRGKLVSIAIDGGGVPDLPRFQLFNRMIGISDFVPRTCYRSGIPSFMPKIGWQGDRINAEMVLLPAPKPNESRDDFVARWTTAFTSEITSVFIESPENLRMAGGFWTGIAV